MEFIRISDGSSPNKKLNPRFKRRNNADATPRRGKQQSKHKYSVEDTASAGKPKPRYSRKYSLNDSTTPKAFDAKAVAVNGRIRPGLQSTSNKEDAVSNGPLPSGYKRKQRSVEHRSRSADAAVQRPQTSGYKRQHYTEEIPQSKKRRIVWQPSGRMYTCDIVSLHQEILDFYEYVRPKEEDLLLRKDLVDRVTKVVCSLWNNAKVKAFGSFETGLYLPSSDIDLVVFGRWETLPLWTLKEALISHGLCTKKSILVIEKAVVPIVKFTDSVTSISVDISFNVINGVKTASLINSYLDQYPALRYLVMILKQFLVQRDLNQVFTGGLSSYSLTLLIVSFFQLHPRSGTKKFQKGNLGVLLLEFLQLYGALFDYDNLYISVQEKGRYHSKASDGNQSETNYRASSISIRDPLQPDNDISRGSYEFLQVQDAFSNAYELLHHALCCESDSDFADSLLSSIVSFRDV